MKRLVAAILLGAAVLVSGCASNHTSVGIHRIVYRPIAASQSVNFPQIAERVLTQRGWQVTARREGEIDATYSNPDARADITIAYTPARYEIKYRDSEGLHYARGRIHRHYNNWIEYIDRDIQAVMRAS
jgi:hypothetical protein